jgi:hypothetical protein
MKQISYFEFSNKLKTCEEILEKIRNEKEKLLQAELQERFNQPIELKKSFLTEYLKELEEFFYSIGKKEQEFIASIYKYILSKNARIFKYQNQEILKLTAEKEEKEWELFAKSADAPLPVPTNAIFYNKDLYNQLILRNLPKLEDSSDDWYLPIQINPISLPIPSKYAFEIFNNYYKVLIDYWTNLKVDFEFPKTLPWKDYISNPDTGVYLHIASLNFTLDNLSIKGETEDHEPYFIENLVIKNFFELHWKQNQENVLLRILVFDSDDKNLPFLIHLPYIFVEAEPLIKKELIDTLMNT